MLEHYNVQRFIKGRNNKSKISVNFTHGLVVLREVHIDNRGFVGNSSAYFLDFRTILTEFLTVFNGSPSAYNSVDLGAIQPITAPKIG